MRQFAFDRKSQSLVPPTLLMKIGIVCKSSLRCSLSFARCPKQRRFDLPMPPREPDHLQFNVFELCDKEEFRYSFETVLI